MNLFEENLTNEFQIYRYTDPKQKSKIQMKYPVFHNDTVRELLRKIVLSIDDKRTHTENFIFPFIQKNVITPKQIEDLEIKIVPNPKLRKLIKGEFPDFNKLNNTDMKEFVKKNKQIMEEEIQSGNKGYLWIKKIHKEYINEYKKLNSEQFSNEDLFENSLCLSHDFEDIKLNLLNDTELDSNLLNNDNSLKLITPRSKLDTNLMDYGIFTNIYCITAKDYLSYLQQKLKIEPSMIFRGLLRKYYPFLTNERELSEESSNYSKLRNCFQNQLKYSCEQMEKLKGIPSEKELILQNYKMSRSLLK